MIKYLIKSTNEIRVETKDEADDLHKMLTKEAEEKDFTLAAWSETKKEKKAKGEIVEEWYIVKYTFIFNDAKDPERPLKSINYDLMEGYKVEEDDDDNY